MLNSKIFYKCTSAQSNSITDQLLKFAQKHSHVCLSYSCKNTFSVYNNLISKARTFVLFAIRNGRSKNIRTLSSHTKKAAYFVLFNKIHGFSIFNYCCATSFIEKLILPILSLPKQTTVTTSPKVSTSSTWLILSLEILEI